MNVINLPLDFINDIQLNRLISEHIDDISHIIPSKKRSACYVQTIKNKNLNNKQFQYSVKFVKKPNVSIEINIEDRVTVDYVEIIIAVVDNKNFLLFSDFLHFRYNIYKPVGKILKITIEYLFKIIYEIIYKFSSESVKIPIQQSKVLTRNNIKSIRATIEKEYDLKHGIETNNYLTNEYFKIIKNV